MRALIMAAGLGTRLRPLTENCPKPLVQVMGRPMMEYVLELLAKHGISEALVNIHYLPDQMRTFIKEWNDEKKVPKLFIQDESNKILGTGGALSMAADWLFAEEPDALVCNSDVISDADLKALIAKHKSLGNRVELTMSLVAHPEAGIKYTGVRKQADFVTGFERPGKQDNGLFHFPGFYIVNKSVIPRLPKPGEEFSIMEKLWKNLVIEKKLGAWVYFGQYLDLGTPEDIAAAEHSIKSKDR